MNIEIDIEVRVTKETTFMFVFRDSLLEIEHIHHVEDLDQIEGYPSWQHVFLGHTLRMQNNIIEVILGFLGINMHQDRLNFVSHWYPIQFTQFAQQKGELTINSLEIRVNASPEEMELFAKELPGRINYS